MDGALGFNTFEKQDKVLVGLNGGMDATVTVRILQEQGFAVQAALVHFAGMADDAVETEALLRALKAGFDEYLGMNPRLGKAVAFAIVSSDDPAFLSEYMPANLLFRYEDKQAVMDEGTLNGRLKKLIDMLRRECQVMKIEKEIAEKVNDSMDKN